MIWIGILLLLSVCGIISVFIFGRIKRRTPERVRETTEQLDLDLAGSEYQAITGDTNLSNSSNF